METKRDGLFSYHTLNDKERKNLMILELIKKKGPISRTDISHITDINMVSTSNYIKNYIDKKFVHEKGFDVSTGGRRPELVEFNATGGYVIGVDVNTIELSAVVTNLAAQVIAKGKVPKPAGALKEVVDGAVALIEKIIKESNINKPDIRAIGLGIAGNNFLSFTGEIEKKTGIETYAGSDAACAAFGEKKLNPEADVEDMLYMYSDVGCGIVVRGDIYFGAGGSAGEMHAFNERISKEEDSVFFKESQYLRPWCIELGIIQAAKREIARGIGTKMVALASGHIENVTKQVVIEAARQNDEIALDIIKNAGINLGIRTAYLVNLFDPEVVVVGGSIEKAGDIILNPIKNAIKKFAFNKQASLVRIIPSMLGEEGVSLGAASLAIREIFLKA
ncbi:MAG: ROK family protein [Candidatus Omnitrophota bacterium]|jgi:predicted NBD/HSP70 family sugar kinase